MTTELKMNDVFGLFEPTETATAETIAALTAAFGEVSVSEIGGLKKFEFAARIKKEAPAVTNAISVAGAILDFMRENEFVTSDAPAPAVAPQMPASIKVELPENISTMSLRKLFELIAGEPSRFGEVYPYIEANAQFKLALAKTANVAIPLKEGGLDVEATLAYIGDLARQHSKVQRSRNGVRPVSIEKALGLEIRALIHPFTGEAVSGPDENGFDFGHLSDELHRALIWARRSKHAAWPKAVDAYEHGEEVLSDPLPRRWATILDDYRHAVANEEESTLGITRYWTETARKQEKVESVTASSQGGEWTEDDYRRALYDIAQASRSSSMGSVRAGHEVVRSISASMGSVRLNGTIVLEGVRASMGSINGSAVYIPSTSSVTADMGSVNVGVYPQSWKRLYERAQSYGLI